ncbi:ABC transporter substrate-binding protein [Pseudomonas sp. RIT-PI-S]|uniref:ABC transporter substrate-binding protein n=1 Tax=Pseudomonas sp. RIT-PI-S TaxID=3035295 RepID=UPI0021DB0778|nr:ABC transporter substrate-binding protein [Pseudomonas sp. RIT-PI-S]
MKHLCKHLAAPLLALLLAGQALAAPVVVRIGSPDQGAGPQPFVAGVVGLAHIRQQLEQALAADDVSVEWHFFKGAGPAINEALANQQLDLAWLGDLAAIIGRASGLETRWVLGARGANMYLAVRPGLSIQHLADLKGKRVAVYRGTADQLSFARALASEGLQERDLQIVSLDWAAARAALVAGQIDATWSGMGVLGLAERGVTFPLSTQDLPPLATTQAGLIATQAFIEAHPQVLQHIVDVLVANAAWISDAGNRDAYTRLMAERSQLPATLFNQELSIGDPLFRGSPRLDPFLADSLQASVEQAKTLGLIRRAFDARAWLAPQFVDQALERQKLQALWPAYNDDGKPL